MKIMKNSFRGGSDGNEQLTAIVATLLLVLLAVESATLLNLRSLLTVHAFIGMLLIPLVVLKLASTGWRMLRYYRRAEQYVRRGPPHMIVRALVAPVTVVSTVTLFVTGVILLVVDQTRGTVVGLHKASFIVWLSAMSLHVLSRIWTLRPALRRRLAGRALRYGLTGATLASGLLLGVLALPAADRLQDNMSGSIGIDSR